MAETHIKGETHGCIVCGRLYQLYVVTDARGIFVDAKVMSKGGKLVPNAKRPLVACATHTDAEIESAVARTYGAKKDDDDDG
jgi:hypothetical protein